MKLKLNHYNYHLFCHSWAKANWFHYHSLVSLPQRCQIFRTSYRYCRLLKQRKNGLILIAVAICASPISVIKTAKNESWTLLVSQRLSMIGELERINHNSFLIGTYDLGYNNAIFLGICFWIAFESKQR